MIGKFCGKIAPSPIISSGGQLLIKFVSDYETHGAGFSVRYEVFKTGAWLLTSGSRRSLYFWLAVSPVSRLSFINYLHQFNFYPGLHADLCGVFLKYIYVFLIHIHLFLLPWKYFMFYKAENMRGMRDQNENFANFLLSSGTIRRLRQVWHTVDWRNLETQTIKLRGPKHSVRENTVSSNPLFTLFSWLFQENLPCVAVWAFLLQMATLLQESGSGRG